jgi:hypothetical protein
LTLNRKAGIIVKGSYGKILLEKGNHKKWGTKRND